MEVKRVGFVGDLQGAEVMRLRRSVLGARCVVLFLLVVSANALAFDESLSFRRAPSGSIEAVISGWTDTCDAVFWSPGAVTIEGATITIVSPDGSVMCGLPVYPPRAYSATADLGILTGESYRVVWSEAVDNGTRLQMSAVLMPALIAGGRAISAPTLSWLGLGVLALVLGMFAWCRLRLNRLNMRGHIRS